MLQALEETTKMPAKDDLAQLFAQLKPASLPVLLESIDRTQNTELRPLLESATERLARDAATLRAQAEAQVVAESREKLVAERNAIAAAEAVFDAPMKSTEHEADMLRKCLARMDAAFTRLGA